MGFCGKKVENGGVFFVKRWTFPQRKVHYVQYQYLLFLHYTFYLFGVGVPHPPASGPDLLQRSAHVRSVCITSRNALVVLEVLMSAVQSI